MDPTPSAGLARLTARASELREHFLADGAARPDDAAATEVGELLALAADAYRTTPAARAPALGVLLNLAPCLARLGRLSELQGALTVTVEVDDPWERVPGLLETALEACLAAHPRDEDRGAAEEVATLALRLASLEPFSEARWRAAASLLREGCRRLAASGRWDRHRALLARFPEVPAPHVRATAPALAGALADGAILAAAGAPFDYVAGALEALEAMAPLDGEPGVRAERATAQGCVLEWLAGQYGEGRVPDDLAWFRRCLDGLVALADRWPGDRGVAQPLAAAAPFALQVLLAMPEEPALLSFLDRLGALAARHPGDDEVAFSVARGLVNAACVRCGDGAAAAPSVAALEKALRACRDACPASAEVADAWARFERVRARAAARRG